MSQTERWRAHPCTWKRRWNPHSFRLIHDQEHVPSWRGILPGARFCRRGPSLNVGWAILWTRRPGSATTCSSVFQFTLSKCLKSAWTDTRAWSRIAAASALKQFAIPRKYFTFAAFFDISNFPFNAPLELSENSRYILLREPKWLVDIKIVVYRYYSSMRMRRVCSICSMCVCILI